MPLNYLPIFRGPCVTTTHMPIIQTYSDKYTLVGKNVVITKTETGSEIRFEGKIILQA